MFEMDHGTSGARITALFSISKARALEEFSAFSHRSFVSIIAKVWLQETIEVNMLVIRTPKKGVGSYRKGQLPAGTYGEAGQLFEKTSVA